MYTYIHGAFFKLRFIFCILLAFGLTVCAFPISAQTTEEPDTADTVSVVVLVNDVKSGTLVGKEDIKTVNVPDVNIPANIISDPEKVAHLYATENLYAGEYVAKGQVSDEASAKINPHLLKKPIVKSNYDYVIVTDYVIPNTGECLAVYLQQIIDKNPKRTIYFPDGEYVISTSLFTSSHSRDSVSIRLSDGAVIKASKDFKSKDGDALIHLGGSTHMHDISPIGSYYVFSGGTLDGNMVANGLAVNSGRESVIRDICIKNPRTVGLFVDRCVEYGSSDHDFEDITIIGSGAYRSKGVYVIGSDNTFSNIRIYNMAVGFELSSGGNLIKNIYVHNSDDWVNSVITTQGMKVAHDNWVSQCHVVNANTAFSFEYGIELWDCSAEWTTDKLKKQTFVEYTGPNLLISGCRADFCVGDGVVTSLVGGSPEVCYVDSIAVNVLPDESAPKYHLTCEKAIMPRS